MVPLDRGARSPPRNWASTAVARNQRGRRTSCPSEWSHDFATGRIAPDLARVVATYRSEHPSTPATARLADPDAVSTWLESLGVAGARLPVHVFIGPDGTVRCVRASAVEDTDFDENQVCD